MERRFRFRVAMLVLLVLGSAGGIGWKLHRLQIVQRDALRSQAASQHRTWQEIPGRRGSIVDRHGHELAASIDTQSLYAHPARFRDDAEREAAADTLAPLLGTSRARLANQLGSRRSFVWLARRLDPATVDSLRDSGIGLGGDGPFGLKTEAKRFYPRGSLGVHLVGYAGSEQRGLEGIERQFDRALSSDPTRFVAARDGRGRMTLEAVGRPGKQPEDVALTIDLVLQHIVERELDRVARKTRARAASAILLDPMNGEVLALANRPTVDPNHYGKSSAAARRNGAIVDLYEPGSTFKVFTAAAALDRGTVGPSNRFDCENGGTRIAGHYIRDHHPYGVLTLRQVLEKSSNVGMIKVGRTLSRETLHDYITRFGFGRASGIAFPGESPGMLKPVGRWNALTPATVAFGQGIGVTSLQLAAAFGAIANDGIYVPPSIVLGRRDASGRFLPAEPKPSRRAIESSTARRLTELLLGVVERGTGTRAQVEGYRVAGKTGTAQIPSGGSYHPTLHVSSFGGFAPVRAPRLVGLVVVHAPRVEEDDGGLVAAPVFARIMREALAHLRVVPDDPVRFDDLASAAALSASNEPAPKPAFTPPVRRKLTGEGQVPDVRGLSMREAISTLAQLGYRSRVDGSGIVVAQSPAPGTERPRGEACSIRLRPASRSYR